MPNERSRARKTSVEDTVGQTAVLLINLGTPAAPKTEAVRGYLREFLSDPRIVDMPRALWLPILHAYVLRVRPRETARRYAAIWTKKGSPLKLQTEKQTRLLNGFLGQAGHSVRVEYAMRYGQPSVASVLSRLAAEGCVRVLLLPLYPQYSAGTTASAFDAAFRWTGTQRNPPELRTVRGIFREPGYIAALAASVERHWAKNGRPQSSYRLLMSFHGIPAKAVKAGDPYRDECLATSRLLARALDLDDDEYAVSFQSRLGSGQWLQPYTAAQLEDFARKGIHRVDVLCPGFAADCLETLEEIAIEGKAIFQKAGGEEYFLIPCLNDDEGWIRALEALVLRHLQGWPTRWPSLRRRSGNGKSAV
ncbi:MAG: ferrochelatase [Candidatus Accumulibacter sp.]|jgi:ferrochelatase|nr:ferrochelatase [Accumulibacter sp.]